MGWNQDEAQRREAADNLPVTPAQNVIRVPRCSSCQHHRCFWTDDEWWYCPRCGDEWWYCPRCGDEWCQEHNPMYAPPDVHVYAVVCFDGWAGVRTPRVEVVGETDKRYRVVALTHTKWAGRNRYLNTGETALVPKHAVKFEELANSSAI